MPVGPYIFTLLHKVVVLRTKRLLRMVLTSYINTLLVTMLWTLRLPATVKLEAILTLLQRLVTPDTMRLQFICTLDEKVGTLRKVTLLKKFTLLLNVASPKNALPALKTVFEVNAVLLQKVVAPRIVILPTVFTVLLNVVVPWKTALL